MTTRYVFKAIFASQEYYIGVRLLPEDKTPSTDTYLGSGKAVKRKVREEEKHNGRTSAIKEIIAENLTHDEAYALEDELVTYETLADPLCLNLVRGGRGGYLKTVPLSRRWQRDKKKLQAAVEKTANHRRGKTKDTDAGLRKMSETLSGRTKETHPYLLERGKKLTGRTKETYPGLASASEKMRTISSNRTKVTCPGRVRQAENLSANAAKKAKEKLEVLEGIELEALPIDLFLQRYSRDLQEQLLRELLTGVDRKQLTVKYGMPTSTFNAFLRRLLDYAHAGPRG